MPLKRNIFSAWDKKKRPRKTTKRKINPEFTLAVRVAKLIRGCAASMPPDRKRFHRLAKFILHEVIQQDTQHPPGERQILPEHLQVFEGYEFEPDFPVSNFLTGDIMLTIADQVSMTIPFPVLIPPKGLSDCKTSQESNHFYKVILLGIGIDFSRFTATSVHTIATPWIAMNEQLLSPVKLDIPNDNYLFIATGIAFANSTVMPVRCAAVKIIAVNR